MRSMENNTVFVAEFGASALNEPSKLGVSVRFG